MDQYIMRHVLEITKALADENRLRVVASLRDRELCVCQITELLGLAPSTVSKHMSILRHADLVEGRKDGRWMYYKLPCGDVSPESQSAIAWVCESLKDARRIQQDTVKLEEILSVNREELCQKQTSCQT